MAQYTKNKKRSENQEETELYESPDALAEKLLKTEAFVKKNKILLAVVGAAIALTIGGIFGYKYYKSEQNSTAQTEMFQAVYYFENGEYQNALQGDGANYGFIDIINNYGGTKAANLAHYYAGAAHLHQDNFNQAIEYLKEFASDDLLVQAKAYDLIGSAYSETEKYSQAASFYQKAATYKSNEYFSPGYWLKAGMAYENAENYQKAVTAYDKIINQYPESQEIRQARKYKYRVQELMNE